MNQQIVMNKIIAENFSKMKYISIILCVYVIIILVTDFAPLNIWNTETIKIYRILDILLAVISVFATSFFWFYRKDNYQKMNFIIKLICLLILSWAAIITGVEFGALGFSTLILVILLLTFFIYVDLSTAILFFLGSFLVLGATLLIRKQAIENLNALLFTIFSVTIIAILISKRNYVIKVNDLNQSLELQTLNDELSNTKNELETSNKELVLTNEELVEKKEKLELTLKELKKAQNQLVQSEKMASLGLLAAGVAHEINNPVNFISSSLTALRSNLEYLAGFIQLYSNINESNYKVIFENINNKEVGIEELMEMFRKSVEIIGVGVERTTKIVNGLRTFARTSRSEPEKYDLNESIDMTLLILKGQYKNRINIKKKYGKIPLIVCYPDQLNQVFMNIIGNAIQSIKEKGAITIATEVVDEEKVSVSIKDTGEGISLENKNHIFDPFFTTKQVGKGTGLGLSISYNIIKEHGGIITVESEEGKGSTFIIELPVKINGNNNQ